MPTHAVRLVISLFWGILSSKYYIRTTMQALARRAPFDPNEHYSLHLAGTAAIVENNLLAIESVLIFLKVSES